MLLTVSRFLKRLWSVDGQHFLVGKVGLIIVALSLGRGRKATPVVLANEQVDPNERILRTHVAKGSLLEMLDTPLSKLPAATWFFYP
nr:hypothetical protein [Salinibacter pepae]